MKKATAKKRGRRLSKYTEPQVGAALTAAHGIVSVAAKGLHCAPKTVYEYLQRHPSLKDVLAAARETAIDHVESKLMGAIDDGNVTAIIFFLKTQGKSRGYTERSEPGLTTDGEPFKFTIKINGKLHDNGGTSEESPAAFSNPRMIARPDCSPFQF